ncbi:tetratricopeptide repeat protein, partial [Myxococcota bacterium]|nr:tetratricopeptide repeat protein [Myxococcota bacterium]
MSALVAHAEARPRHGLVLADPGVLEESIRALDARPAPWAEATERLASLGVLSPGVEAARRALNPTQTLAEAPSPVVTVANGEWDILLELVRAAGVGAEALGLAERLGLVAVAGVWRAEGARRDGVPTTPLGSYGSGLSTEGLRALRADLERAGDERGAARVSLHLADLLHLSGEPEEALRLLREEALPVFVRLGDAHHTAIAMGGIADVLQARGQLDEALRIRREEVLPAFERLGDVRAKAITMSKIADVLEARGQLDEA